MVNKRENGYYWITWLDRQVAKYEDGIWWLPGNNEGKYEDELYDINENQVLKNGK